MAYFSNLQYATGYFMITPEGEVIIKDDMPPEMRARFLVDIEEERKRCEENHKNFKFSSADLF